MKTVLALGSCALLLAAPSLAQDEGTPPEGDTLLLESEAPRGLLDDELPESVERQNALLLQNFLAMDQNRDLILAKTEWEVWSGWLGSPAPDFASVDVNASMYLSYREYEDAALSGVDARMGEPMHGAAFPEED